MRGGRWSNRRSGRGGQRRWVCRAPVDNSLAGSDQLGSLTHITHRGRTQPPDGPPPPTGPTLDAASVEAVARRVVELIRSEGDSPAGRRLVDAATLAAELGVERSWVYAHRAELGAIQLGSGSKPRLRFEVEVAEGLLASFTSSESCAPQSRVVVGSSSRRRRRRMGGRAELLPIRGVAAATDTGRERPR